ATPKPWFSGAATISPRRSVQPDSSGWPYFQSMRLKSAAPTGRLSMRLRKMASLLALLSLAATPLITGSRSEAAFKKLQSLAGEWEGKDDHGMAVKTNFRILASKTAVMETLSPSGMDEMIKLYSRGARTIPQRASKSRS